MFLRATISTMRLTRHKNYEKKAISIAKWIYATFTKSVKQLLPSCCFVVSRRRGKYQAAAKINWPTTTAATETSKISCKIMYSLVLLLSHTGIYFSFSRSLLWHFTFYKQFLVSFFACSHEKIKENMKIIHHYYWWRGLVISSTTLAS